MIWKGPFVEGVRGSSLTKFDDCLDRFLLMIKGYRAPKAYDKKIYCGDLWHKGMDGPLAQREQRMRAFFENTLNDNPKRKNEIIEMTKLVNGVYKIFREVHNFGDPHKTEYNFRCKPIDGCPVIVKGTMDGVTVPGNEGYIREWKVRGTVSDYEIDRLGFSYQTMTYHSCFRKMHGHKAEGTQYCLIQRPLGNRDAPKFRKTKETKDEFYKRVWDQIRDNPDKYLKVVSRPVTNEEIDHFEKMWLSPILNYLGWWWYCQCIGRPELAFHRRTPWGLYSNVRQKRIDDYDDYYLGTAPAPHDPSLRSEDI